MRDPWEQQLALFISDRFGFRLEEHGRNVIPLIQGRIQERGENPEQYIAQLRRATDTDNELGWLVEAFTIGETTFGRDPEQLQAIQQIMVERQRAIGRPLQVWSAACATGEEAFTLAILMQEAGVAGTVLGTDLNERSLQTARSAGPYSSYRMMPVPERWKTTWFIPSGSGFTVSAAVKANVRFARHNLLEPPPQSQGGWDIILCRNVLIYFAPDTVDHVFASLLNGLHPDGALFLGAGDPVHTIRQPAIKRRLGERTAYLRPGQPARTGLPPLPPSGAERPVQPGYPPPAPPSRSDPPDAHLGKAAQKLSLHDFVGAQTELDAALQLAPQSADAHYLLGVTFLKRRAQTQAGAAFEAAIRCNRRHWPAMVLLAGLRQEQRQLLHAELHYRKALDLMSEPQPLQVQFQGANLVSSAHSNLAEARALARSELQNLQQAQLRAPIAEGTRR